MAVPITPITLNDLTLATLDGTGVFDVLMRANKAHLEAEFKQNRIKGPEYSTVYLGSLEAVMSTALQFLLQRDKNNLEAGLLEQQILLAQAEVLKANAAVELLREQILNTIVERDILLGNKNKVDAEIAQLTAQTALTGQQTTNLMSEGLNIPKQGAVLDGQKCKLDAEFDLLKSTNLKTAEEIQLLLWKTNTEKAQTLGMGVDDNSVIGKQKLLYTAQTAGYQRDAEQKTADLMAKTWMARRTTDEATVADGVNMLNDAAVGRAVNKLLSGVGA